MRAFRGLWGGVAANRLESSWDAALDVVVARAEEAQAKAALLGTSYVAESLGELGDYVPPTDFPTAAPLVGVAPDGRSLRGLLETPRFHAVRALRNGLGVSEALNRGRNSLDVIARTLVADTARQAASIDVAARRTVGYVRMLNPPSCSRCTILAGRFYRWNAGFLRHPRCDCVHVPATEKSVRGGRAEGLISDPYEYFDSLSEAEQARQFGKNYAQAIRDGADISQVVNSKRWRSENGIFTSEGMGKHGNARRLLKPGQRRLTPDGIYRQAQRFNLSREETLGLLREHGYVLPGGRNPLGAIRGQREGFGALGRGGSRKRAAAAVEEARAHGWRTPSSVYTMTATERRVFEAIRDWEEVQAGLNPYTEAAIQRRQGVRPWSVDRPLRDVERVRAEIEYRAALETTGASFTPEGRSLAGARKAWNKALNGR